MADNTSADLRAVLGVGPSATDDEVRAAYLQKVREHPPDRSPEAFERIRDAYEALRDPRQRARHLLFSIDPAAPLTALLDGRPPARQFIGPAPWIEALKTR